LPGKIANFSTTVQEAQLPRRGPRDALYEYIHAMFHEAWELERFHTPNVTFKIIQGHWQ